MMYHAWPMTHDGTPIEEVNQAIWLGRLDKDWSDNTDTQNDRDLDIMRTAARREAAVKNISF